MDRWISVLNSKQNIYIINCYINRLLCDLLQSIREYIGCLFQLNADIAELDLITSLAQISSLQTYVRPLFGSKLELIDSRHPIMDVFGLDNPVPNNIVIYLSTISNVINYFYNVSHLSFIYHSVHRYLKICV